MRIPIGIVGPSYQDETFDGQRTVNLYPRLSASGSSKAIAALVGTPGIETYVTLPQGPVRGARVAAGRLFAVAGAGLYEITGAAAYSLRGTLSTTTGLVGMTDDGDELVFGDGTGFFVFNLNTDTLSPIDGSPPGVWCDVVSSVVLAVEVGTGKLWYTEPTDASEIAGLNFVTAESAPDKLVTLKVDHGEVLLFGETTVETWAYTGAADNAVERISNAVVEHGCAAGATVQKLDNSVLWLGAGEHGHGIVWRLQGGAGIRVSTHAVETALSASSDLSLATAWSYQQDGHTFYAITAPDLETTWVYDASTQLWHERASFAGGEFQRHRADGHVFWNSLHLVWDHESGAVYSFERDAYADDGDTLLAMRRTAYAHAEGAKVFFHRLWVDFDTGVGLTIGQGADPTVMLRYSDDGGRTWSNQITASIGAIGDYRVRALFRRLGGSRNRLFEVSMSDPVRRKIIAAFADVTFGAY